MGFWWYLEDGVLDCGRWIDGFGLNFWRWWRIEDRMGRWWVVRSGMVLMVQIKLGVGDLVPTCSSPAVIVVGDSLLMPWGRGWIRGGFFIRALILVSGFWLGSISPYSFELGLRFSVVPLLWRHYRGQVGQHSVTLVVNLLMSDPCTWSGTIGARCGRGCLSSWRLSMRFYRDSWDCSAQVACGR